VGFSASIKAHEVPWRDVVLMRTNSGKTATGQNIDEFFIFMMAVIFC
jgi:hypothetical protein